MTLYVIAILKVYKNSSCTKKLQTFWKFYATLPYRIAAVAQLYHSSQYCTEEYCTAIRYRTMYVCTTTLNELYTYKFCALAPFLGNNYYTELLQPLHPVALSVILYSTVHVAKSLMRLTNNHNYSSATHLMSTLL